MTNACRNMKRLLIQPILQGHQLFEMIRVSDQIETKFSENKLRRCLNTIIMNSKEIDQVYMIARTSLVHKNN